VTPCGYIVAIHFSSYCNFFGILLQVVDFKIHTMSDQPPIIIAGTESKTFARKIAQELGLGLGRVEVATFSDSETHVLLHADVKNRDVYIVQATSAPTNENIMQLLLMAHAARSGKAKKITAVMPFFGYRRQEKQTVSGEAVSFQLIAKLMKAAGISRVLTIDLHKHRSAKYFKEAGIISKELRAFPVIIDHLRKKKLDHFVVLAPDKGSIPESKRYADGLGVPLIKVYKHRSIRKRDEVKFDEFEGEVKGRNVLIIDDEVNTAGTLMGVVDILKEKKAHNVYFACTHGVLSGPALSRLAKSNIRQVILMDTIYLPLENRIQKIKILSVAPLFAEQIGKWAHWKKN